MLKPISRRTLLAAAAAGLAMPRAAGAALPTLTAVEWGGATGEAMRALQSEQQIAQIRWEEHAGGAAAILAKIQAALPRVNYDVVAAWSPVFVTMIAEDWLETVSVAEMPNLAQIPDALFMKDKAGALKTIPRDINPQLWGEYLRIDDKLLDDGGRESLRRPLEHRAGGLRTPLVLKR